MVYGKAIELFLVNGTAESLVTAELSNWNGKAIKIPRTEVQQCNREDLINAGVYFLFCKEDSDIDSVYIGEAENVLDRLNQHLRDYNSDKEKYYWNSAVVFTGRDLNKALIRYLENDIFEKDYEFNAPSAASAVILGRTSNGNIDWKNDSGISLKDINE